MSSSTSSAVKLTVPMPVETFAKGKPPLISPFVSAAAEPVTIKKVTLIYNPKAGLKKGRKQLFSIVIPTLKAAGVDVNPTPTKHAGHATEMVRDMDLSDTDAVIIMGGDGSLGEAASGYMQRASGAASCPLGFIPGGTGNTYMREVLGVKTVGGAEVGVRAAVEAILGGRVRHVDAVKLEMTDKKDGASKKTHYSINTTMAGFGPTANQVAERRRFLGPLRYDLSIYTELMKIPFKKPMACTLTLDGQSTSMDDLFLMACQNNKFTGVAHRFAPRAQLDDGYLDAVYTNKRLTSIPKAITLDGAIKSGGKHCSDQLVSYQRVKTVRLETETPQPLMVDGDVIGLTPVDMTVAPGAFPLLTPEAPPAS